MLGEGQKNSAAVKINFNRLVGTAAIFLCLLFGLAALTAPSIAGAQTLDTGIDYGAYTNLADTDIRIIIAKIIRVALGLVGIVVLGFVIYGGYMYMTAAGNEEQTATAKKILKNTVIGLAIILMSFAITQFIISTLLGQYQSMGGQESASGGTGSDDFRSSGFLGSIIESHYPGRNERVPRNTKIVVTFRQPILESSVIVNGQIVSENVKIYPTPPAGSRIAPVALGTNPASAEDDVYANITADKKTIVLRPKNFLGNAREDADYTVDLAGIKLANGQLAFSGTASHYAWQFIVTTELDVTPPKVESVVPMPDTNPYARNILVQINFNEAVDPISASGFFQSGDVLKNFQNINLRTAAGLVAGEYRLLNQYRTVEFKSIDECGKNPCGQSIYCLPAKQELTATVKAASVDPENAPQALIGANLYDGVVDMVGNSLDGGGELKLVGENLQIVPGTNGVAGGPPTDNFVWKFFTSAELHTGAPQLINVEPSINGVDVAAGAPLTLSFDELMSVSSFSEIILKTNKEANVWYTVKAINYDSSGNPVTRPEQIPRRTSAELSHGAFVQEPTGVTSAIYYPFAPSSINDGFQNCFYPAVCSQCRAGTGECTAYDSSREANPSCYNGRALPGASKCGAGETCPYSVPPKP